MRGTKATLADEEYDAAADGEDRQGGEKPLSSKYRGVCWNRKNKRWQAAINSGGKYVYLGSFISEYDAARAFDKAAVKLRGTRAKLNFSYSEYVDEHGNLLEDPAMKNVMYKIEAIQGGGSGGKHDHGMDDAGAHFDAFPLPAVSGRANQHSNGNTTPPLPAPRGPSSKATPPRSTPAAVTSTADPPRPDWQPQPQQPRVSANSGGALPPSLGIDLHGGLPHGPDGPLFPHFPELPAPGPLSTGLGVGGLLAGLPMALPPSLPPGPGKGAPPPPISGCRPRAPSSGGLLQSLPTFAPLGGVTPGASPLGGHLGPGGRPGHPAFSDPATTMGQVLHAMNEHPHGNAGATAGGGGGGAGALARSADPSPAAQRAILRGLGAGVQITSYVPNRFSSHAEDEMCGVLFSEPGCEQYVGSAVWTGSRVVKMGSYDTERDARQAAIKGMQLVHVFCPDELRVEIFSRVEDKEGCAAAAAAGDHAGCDGGALPPQSRGTQARAGPAGEQLPPLHHTPQNGMPYMRTSANGGAAYPEPAATTVAAAGGRVALPQMPAGPASGQPGAGQQQQQQQPGSDQACRAELFQYMAGLGRRGPHSEREGCGDGQAAGSSLLGKRHAEDDLAHAHQRHQHPQQHQHQQGGEGAKRGRPDGSTHGASGADAGSEMHEAHKLPLSAMVKQLEQVAAGR